MSISKKETWQERNERQNKERDAHRMKLECEHMLTGHPKAKLLYEIAWREGHASGWSEIESVYSEFSELLKP